MGSRACRHGGDCAAGAAGHRAETTGAFAAPLLAVGYAAGRYREIRYEQLVEDAEGTLRETCGFLGLDFQPDMLEYHHSSDRATLKDHPRLAEPPTPGMRSWQEQMPPREAEVFEAIALVQKLAFSLSDDDRLLSMMVVQEGVDVLVACPDAPRCWIYTVRTGDNFQSIVNWFGVPYDTVVAMNPGLGDVATIHVGDRIRMPPPTR